MSDRRSSPPGAPRTPSAVLHRKPLGRTCRCHDIQRELSSSTPPGRSAMNPTKSLARRAGWLYLLQCQPAPFAYLYVPNRLLVPGDVVATFERVRASEGLLRAAVLAELLSATLSLFAMVALYRLFR